MQAINTRRVLFFGIVLGIWLAVSALLFRYAGSSDRRFAASAPASAAPALRFYALDDSLPGRNGATFTYSGTWQHLRGRDDGRSNGTSSRSREIGATATLRFRGRWFRLLGVRGPTGGTSAMFIDGRRTGSASFVSRDKEPGVEVYASSMLADGFHTVRIVVGLGAHAKPGYVNVDGATIGTQ